MLSQDAVRLLEDLYAAARDSAQGYREAAESASSGAMKARLYGMARRRNAMAAQLALTLRSLGIETGHHGGIGERLRRHFDELKNKLESGDMRGAVTGIIRGEGAFIESIDRALRETLPDAVHGFLKRQQRQMKGVVERFSDDISRSESLRALKQQAIQYRKPALFVLAAVGVATLAAVLIVQQRRHGTVTRSLASARGAIDKALARLPSASRVRRSLQGLQIPAMHMPEFKRPSFRKSGQAVGREPG